MDLEGVFIDIGQYEKKTTLLGEGAFGKVYIVIDKDGNKYAAKIINSKELIYAESQTNLFREIYSLHKLNHPAIVKLIGINLCSFDDNLTLQPTIITEYLPNKSLKELIHNTKVFTPTKKLINLIGIAAAMRYLHSQGVMHRDLKPQNILIDSNYYPHICDLGLAKCFPESLSNLFQTSMTIGIGTPLYMAPEILIYEKEYGPAVDVYAFSMIAYEIVTGIEPFSINGKSIKYHALLKQISNKKRPTFPIEISNGMKDLISKCWNEDPLLRPSFDTIYQQLSNLHNSSYLKEKVDKSEVINYISNLPKKEENCNSDCQISGKVMKDPVLLSNGVYYEREELIELIKSKFHSICNVTEDIMKSDESDSDSQISGRIIRDPVLASTGVFYEREELLQLLSKHKNPICVITGKKLTEKPEDIMKKESKETLIKQINNQKDFEFILHEEARLSKYKIEKPENFEEAIKYNIKKIILPADKNHPELIFVYHEYDFFHVDDIITRRKKQLLRIGVHESLKHETIMPLIGYSIEYDYFAFFTPFMPNHSLFDLLKNVKKGNAPPNWETIRAINIFGIAAGMAFIHQNNVIHRNLKPTKILLDDNFYPKIDGFEASNFFIEGTQDLIDQEYSIGTLMYSPPEKLIGDLETPYSNKYDVYSYSLILYQLLLLEDPFPKCLNEFKFTKMICDGYRPKISDEILVEQENLLQMCWSSNDKERPSFIKIVKMFMESKEKYFKMELIDQKEFNAYIKNVTKDLNFSTNDLSDQIHELRKQFQ